MHEVLINQFEQLRIGVTIVSDGGQAVAAVEDGEFDLVFMDARCQRQRLRSGPTHSTSREARRGHVPVIAMTANAFKEDRDACLAAGMDDYLSKPVRLKSIAEMIHKWHSAGRRLPRP